MNLGIRRCMIFGGFGLSLIPLVSGSAPPSKSRLGESALAQLANFAHSKAAVEDRNGDGRPDLWRTFYPSGKLQSLTTSARKDGRPDLRFHYSEAGSVTLREYANARTGIFETRIRVVREGARLVERLEGPGLTVTLAKSHLGYYLKRSEFDLNFDGKVDRVSSQLMRPEAWSQVPPGGGPCPPTTAAPGVPTSEMTALLARIGDQIEVDASCEGYQPGGSSTSLTREQLKLQAAQALQSGLECLRARGPAGDRLSNELLSQVFATSSRRLTFRCNTPDVAARCPGQVGVTCGRASRFDEPTFPSIALGSCRGGLEELNVTLFHEALHLAGSDGHQHLHNYSDVEATEHIEPCSQCCQGRAVTSPQATELRKELCALCDDTPATDPSTHTLKYGALLALERNSELAALELNKVVAVRPNNYEAWLHLLYATLRQFQSGSPTFEQLFELRRALLAVEHLRAHPEQRDSLPTQMPTALPDERTAADYVSLASRLVQQHLMEKPLPKGVSDLAPAQRASYLAFRDHQTEARSLMTVCSSMSALTTPAPDAREQRARTCFQRGQDLGGSLARDVDQLEEARRTGNSPSEGSEEPSARSISESDVAQFRSYATRFQAGVQCVSQGTALEECAGARAPTAPASTTSPTSASPAACGPANPLR